MKVPAMEDDERIIDQLLEDIISEEELVPCTNGSCEAMLPPDIKRCPTCRSLQPITEGTTPGSDADLLDDEVSSEGSIDDGGGSETTSEARAVPTASSSSTDRVSPSTFLSSSTSESDNAASPQSSPGDDPDPTAEPEETKDDVTSFSGGDPKRDLTDVPADVWLEEYPISTTAKIKIPGELVSQVIGQEKAVEVISKAATQKRHVLLIGDPGTGKSMLGKAMAELLPNEEVQDILAYPNFDDSNEPIIKVAPGGKGKKLVQEQKLLARQKREKTESMRMMLIFTIFLLTVFVAFLYGEPMFIIIGLFACLMFYWIFRQTGNRAELEMIPKLLVGQDSDEAAPFIDATGAHAGALLGDVRHDPFQSGGLETPAHDRVEAGAIHKANKGVLFIDEMNLLRIESQQSLLTALQEKKFAITGQTERNSGALVKTQAVPCDFVLIAAGNLDSVKGMHPALRSRIRGYGYEVFMKSTMDDTVENREKLIRFVAQEVSKDKKIPHFDKGALATIIQEAQRRAGRKGQLTLRLRELGGLVRVAGDIARIMEIPVVSSKEVLAAKEAARSLEQQVADRYLEQRKEHQMFAWEGEAVGRVNGLAVMGADSGISEYSGLIIPIHGEVTPPQSKSEGRIIATGKLGEIAKEAVQNISALIKKHTGEDVIQRDIHIQFVGTYEGVEGDSASISVATAVFSALEDIPVDQTVAMTGSLSVRGDVLPIGGVTAKIEAAAQAGLKKVIIPMSNMAEVLIEDTYKDSITVIPVKTFDEVLRHALIGDRVPDLIKKMSRTEEPATVEECEDATCTTSSTSSTSMVDPDTKGSSKGTGKGKGKNAGKRNIRNPVDIPDPSAIPR